MKKKTKTKKVTAILLAAALTVGLAGCGQGGTDGTAGTTVKTEADSGSSGTEDDYVVKILVSQGALCHAPIQVAIENGYFEEEGLNYETVDLHGGVVQDAVGAGQVDAGFGLVAKFIQPLENGLPLKVTSGMHTGCNKLLVRKDSGIESVEDLKGKKIGVPGLAASATITTKRALARVGVGVSMEDQEVEFLAYNATDLPVALSNGAIDAIALEDPVATTAQTEYDLVALVDTALDEAFKDEYCCISFVSTELAEKHPELAAKFTRAVMKGSAWVEAHPRETAQMQLEKGYVAGDLELNVQMLESYYYNPSVSGGYNALDSVARELQEIGILKAETDIEAFVENSFAKLEGVPETITLDEADSEGRTVDSDKAEGEAVSKTPQAVINVSNSNTVSKAADSKSTQTASETSENGTQGSGCCH